ncbi:MAG: zinc ribbon domain-containing protein [Gemmatimonadaceae bacterium]
MITALVVGTLLALAGLAFVLYPLFADPGARLASLPPAVDHPEEDAVAALRETEFDRATGKLSDSDYEALRSRYTERALAELRARDSVAAAAAAPASAVDGGGEVVDVAEAAVRRQRARLHECVTCGPRPEPDSVYCSDCGRYLPGCCAGCGAMVDEPGARFCPGCGATLAA